MRHDAHAVAERFGLFQIKAFACHIHVHRFHFCRKLRLFGYDRYLFADGRKELNISGGFAEVQNNNVSLCVEL